MTEIERHFQRREVNVMKLVKFTQHFWIPDDRLCKLFRICFPDI